MTYQLQPDIESGIPSTVILKDGKTWIPMDPANKSYQEYLEWVAEGNTPLPADSE